MKIFTSKNIPPIKKMAEILKQEFSDKFSYELFGIGKEKSIIVEKSTFVGVQISRTKNEISIEGIHPSVPASFISSVLAYFMSSGHPINLWFPGLYDSPWKKFEKEVGSFLNQKYN
ncbi:MAG: hypothetical protein RIG77_20720 [Cyclobacteriaceae bacterium]